MLLSISTFEVILPLIFSASLVAGYSFTFTSQPQQCANFSLQISGSGEPPYSVLVIPSGPTPLSNGVEVREVVYQQFSGDSLSFQLPYPANSQLVAVVSDSTGFGSGGTSVPATVMSSDDASCFNLANSAQPDFVYNINPLGQVVQCSPSRLWWNASQIQGDINFQGVIPGGESFSIPVGTITNQTGMGTGFEWTPIVRSGTTLLVVSGDGRGMGTGGYSSFAVSAGPNPNSSCITTASPSSTAGPPAGGTYSTNANPSPSSTTSTSNNSHSNNTGAIAGGVVGGFAAIAILGLIVFYMTRRRKTKERYINLLADLEDDGPTHYQPATHLLPEPYLMTARSISSLSSSVPLSEAAASMPYDSTTQRHSGVSSSADTPSTTSELVDVNLVAVGPLISASNVHKSGIPKQLKPVKIIQHEDAGPSSSVQESVSPETIELPPAYTRI